MGLHFGELFKGMRGIITYRLSPYEQDALVGLFGKGSSNAVRRTVESGAYWMIPFLVGYTLAYLLQAKHHQLTRKNPDDYKNDE